MVTWMLTVVTGMVVVMVLWMLREVVVDVDRGDSVVGGEVMD